MPPLSLVQRSVFVVATLGLLSREVPGQQIDFGTARRAVGRISATSDRVAVIKGDGSLWTICEFPGFGMVMWSPVFKKQATQIDTATNWAGVSIGVNSLVALKTDGTIWTWVGDSCTRQPKPIQGVDALLVPLNLGTNWISVSGDGAHFTALRSDGTLWQGKPTSPHLTLSVDTNYLSTLDYQIHPVDQDRDWLMASSWLLFTTAIKTNGTIWHWGALLFSSQPRPLDEANNWVFVSCSEKSILAINREGELWTWSIDVHSPASGKRISGKKRIGTDTDWVAASAGEYHNVAVKRDRTLWAWGENNHGQLGDGTYKTRDLPVHVRGGTSILAGVACLHTLGVRNDFAVWVWGRVKEAALPKTPPGAQDLLH